ncbi:M20/M25/M40 family metallo-hydrolase [Desulfurococcaceae archaeon MEX13E-LK6-19]|nr:M20/M25/M40 family metallo-hydrolase [Desulfurococcaceae archaeon MEX13E-LK6-19]
MDIVDLLRELVEIKTVNDPIKGVKPGKEAAKYIHDTLVDWGLEPEIIESSGYYSVFGSIGDGRPLVLLMAHFDTVPVDPSRWDYDPFKLTIVGDKGYGRGALDDKSNVAALMLTVRELSRKKLGYKIYYAFTGDEEIGGVNGAAVIAEKLRSNGSIPKYMINADGVGMKVIIRRRKAFGAVIKVPVLKKKTRGKVCRKTFKAEYPVAQHSHAAYFIPGVDTHPLVSASIFVRETNVLVKSIDGVFLKSNVIPPEIVLEYIAPDDKGDEVEYDEGLTLLLKMIVPLTRMPIPTEKPSEYGVSITPNVYTIADGKHSLYLDIRAMLTDKNAIEKELERLKEELFPEIEYSVRSGSGGYLYTSRNSLLVKSFLNALRTAKEPSEVMEGAGASDSRYFTILGVEAVDFGPRGGNIHGDNEYVVISSLKKLPRIYTMVIEDLVKHET